MKRKLTLTLLTIALLCAPSAWAEDIRHTFAGDDTNSFYIDDRGGSVNNGGSDNSYYLNLLDIDQSAFGTLLLYGDDGNQTTVDDGLVDEDFTNASGITLYDLSVLPGTVSGGEIGLASDAPLTPVSFNASQSGLVVEQVSYTSDNAGDNFVIIEYRVLNPTSGEVDVNLGLSNDFDVDLKSDDAAVGYDDTVVPTVYQQEAAPLDPNHTSVGVSLIRGTEAQHRLEICNGALSACDIFGDDSDFIRTAFFQGADGQVGDLTENEVNRDFAVTIAADLGSIPPDGFGQVVFCYALAGGDDLTGGLVNLLLETNDCNTFYSDEIQICGNGLINYGENCDDGDNDLSDSCPDGSTGSCDPASCGDGFQWTTDGGNEGCDDGDDNVNDSCPSGPSGNCQDATCGDGFLWNQDGGTEQCDNGGANSDITPDACRTNCENPSCGDDVTDTGEDCDDANLNDNDSCLSSCDAAGCGDGFLWNQDGGTEQCDNGGANSNTTPNACRTNCQNAGCGDSVTDNGEQCDDGNNSNNDNCLNSCVQASCGDSFVQQGAEVCDDGNNVSGDGCSGNCQSFESCGNGQIDAGETCDDGNINTSDNCPDGNRGTCRPAFCGDGYLHNTGGGNEQCDDGNNVSGDGCSANCEDEGGGFQSPSGSPSPPVCGNGVVEGDEECDDGGTKNFDGCSEFCTWELILQGGGTSENSPPNPNAGCSLQKDGTRPAGMGWMGLIFLAGLLWLRGWKKGS